MSRYLMPLITPLLAYFAYNGSTGANNLLIVWVGFNFFLTILLAFLFFIMLVSIPPDKRESFKKLTKFRFSDFVSIFCGLFFIWVGWWALAIFTILGIFIIKLIGLVASHES